MYYKEKVEITSEHQNKKSCSSFKVTYISSKRCLRLSGILITNVFMQSEIYIHTVKGVTMYLFPLDLFPLK